MDHRSLHGHAASERGFRVTDSSCLVENEHASRHLGSEWTFAADSGNYICRAKHSIFLFQYDLWVIHPQLLCKRGRDNQTLNISRPSAKHLSLIPPGVTRTRKTCAAPLEGRYDSRVAKHCEKAQAFPRYEYGRCNESPLFHRSKL